MRRNEEPGALAVQWCSQGSTSSWSRHLRGLMGHVEPQGSAADTATPHSAPCADQAPPVQISPLCRSAWVRPNLMQGAAGAWSRNCQTCLQCKKRTHTLSTLQVVLCNLPWMAAAHQQGAISLGCTPQGDGRTCSSLTQVKQTLCAC